MAYAMILESIGAPLRLIERPSLQPGPGQVRVRVRSCGVCRTDLHLIDGELPGVELPRVPGHEIVGHIDAVGAEVSRARLGERVCVPWLGWACGQCAACARGEENLCPVARFTGRDLDGGFSTEAIAEARFVFAAPSCYSDEQLAPLICAGLIGWRALKAAGSAGRIGLYGFGAAAHLIAQVARGRGQEIFAFVRPGDEAAKQFARELGAVWAGGSDESPPLPLDAAILFAPVGALVPAALAAVRPGGAVVCAGIYMSDIPSFPYSLLWGQRTVRSVANLTRADGTEFFGLADQLRLRVTTTAYPLREANRALDDLRRGRISGAAVLTMEEGAAAAGA